jgi:hypothetical protein
MYDDTFQIGLTADTLSDLETLLVTDGSVLEPDWSYKPFSIVYRRADGIQEGNGFPVIKWRFNILTQYQREVLRETFCAVPNLSASVFIHTPITETSSGVLQWETFQCLMHWPTEEEDFQASQDLGIVLVFTHCEAQS